MKSILIIVRDDMRTRFSDIVSDAGYRAITANSVDDALHLATSTSPDLVLLAIVMPELNGLQTAARMRSLPGSKDIPIVLLGSVPPLGIEEEPLASMVNGYLGWDAPAEELVACLTKYAPDAKLLPIDG
jgi:CheY-like chemotaxis protein